jgi:hypothetical protein
MTTRSRSRPRGTASYTARLQQRSAASRPVRHWPDWITTRHWPAALAVLAEAGHLAAALVEWPAGPLRGLFHVLVAAAFGLLAAGLYFGPVRLALTLGIGLTSALPAGWLAGALLNMSPFQDYPTPAAISLTAAELLLAALLTAHRIATPTARPPAHPGSRQRDRQHPARTRAR